MTLSFILLVRICWVYIYIYIYIYTRSEESDINFANPETKLSIKLWDESWKSCLYIYINMYT